MEIGDNIIDSRDIIERLEELQDELERLEDMVTVAADCNKEDAEDALNDFKQSFEYDELNVLTDANDDGERYVIDWKHGETLIRDDYFEEYAQHLAEDIGAIDKDAVWSACHIDWEAAANALKIDYFTITIGGMDYWTR